MRKRYIAILKHRFFIAFLIIAVGFAITPFLTQMAYAERGYKAIGGEYAPLVISFLIAVSVIQGYGSKETERKRKEREKNRRRGCENNVVKVYEVRSDTKRPGCCIARIRTGMCIEIECDGATVYPEAAQEETEERHGFYAITIVKG